MIVNGVSKYAVKNRGSKTANVQNLGWSHYICGFKADMNYVGLDPETFWCSR